MTKLPIALVQLSSTDDPAANLPVTEAYVREAATGGAQLIVTPEVTNMVSMSRARQNEKLNLESGDPTLARLREVADDCGVWLLIGSLAVKGAPDGRFSNRSFLISPGGETVARYDKNPHVRCNPDGARDLSRVERLPARRRGYAGADIYRQYWHDHLLRYAISGPIPQTGAGRGADSHSPLCVHRAYWCGALGSVVTRPCDRNWLFRPCTCPMWRSHQQGGGQNVKPGGIHW